MSCVHITMSMSIKIHTCDTFFKLRIESRMISVYTRTFSFYIHVQVAFLLLDLAIDLYEGIFVLKAKGTCRIRTTPPPMHTCLIPTRRPLVHISTPCISQHQPHATDKFFGCCNYEIDACHSIFDWMNTFAPHGL